ncbi:hypothetical protein Hanom_Chr10g00922031 [Helianthus anomalus]
MSRRATGYGPRENQIFFNAQSCLMSSKADFSLGVDRFCPYSISIWTKVTRAISRQASNVEATANEMLYGCGGTRLRRLNRVKSGESVPFLLLYFF